MRITELLELTKLNTTPLAMVRVENSSVIVDADDEQEQRIRFVLSPYQALKMTTADCFSLPAKIVLRPNVVVEVLDSVWIQQLKHSLSLVDETATFMTKARHFVFPLQDDFLEVVAWGIAEIPVTPDSNPSPPCG
jgi:hypothetical protein